jgi:hypothetical protein
LPSVVDVDGGGVEGPVADGGSRDVVDVEADGETGTTGFDTDADDDVATSVPCAEGAPALATVADDTEEWDAACTRGAGAVWQLSAVIAKALTLRPLAILRGRWDVAGGTVDGA